MQLKLRYYGDPILRERSAPVENFDAELQELAASMVETMRAERGIGLAAPQVGRSVRVIVALQLETSEDTEAEPLVLVNPEILERSQETWILEEGCLSLPGIVGDVTRVHVVKVRYQDVDGTEHIIDATGMLGRILLHEVDHLDGRLFIDYLSPAKKTLLKPALKEIIARRTA